MNILFFLIPKIEVAYIQDTFTLRQALEKMEYHKYSSIPVINHLGKYVGTITEGDILWFLKDNFDLKSLNLENIPVSKIPRRLDNHPVNINSDISDLISKSVNQNFVPVIDDNHTFIGIVTRKDIIQFCYSQYMKKIS